MTIELVRVTSRWNGFNTDTGQKVDLEITNFGGFFQFDLYDEYHKLIKTNKITLAELLENKLIESLDSIDNRLVKIMEKLEIDH